MQSSVFGPELFLIDYIADIIKQHTSDRKRSDNDVAVLSCPSLIYIESGKALLTVGDRSFFAEAKSIVLIQEGVSHSVLSADGAPVSYTAVIFDTSSEYIKNFPTVPLRPDDDVIGVLTSALTFAKQNFKNGFYTYAPSSAEPKFKSFNVNQQILQTYLALFLLLASLSPPPAPTKDSHKQTRHANITRNVESYLKEHVRENISLLETAQHFGYSVSNIQKIFKAVTGKSIIVYFNHLKLEVAKQLIAENTMNFSQISNYLSFSNPNYFSRIFKTTVGMTPTEYAAVYGKKRPEEPASPRSKRKK